MALRLPLQPSPQSAWAVAHERPALGTREPQQFIDIELDGPRSREVEEPA